MCTHLSAKNSKYLKIANRSKAKPTPVKPSRHSILLLIQKEAQAKTSSTS